MNLDKYSREQICEMSNWRLVIGNFAGKEDMPRELQNRIIHSNYIPALKRTVTPNGSCSDCPLSEFNKELEDIVNLSKKLGYKLNGAMAMQFDKYNESKLYICKNSELFILDKEYQDNFTEEWDNFMDGIYNHRDNPRFLFI